MGKKTTDRQSETHTHNASDSASHRSHYQFGGTKEKAEGDTHIDRQTGR